VVASADIHARPFALLFPTPMNEFHMRIASILFAILPLALPAQMLVDKPIVLTGPDAPSRQVTGLAPSAASDAVLTAGVEQQGSYRTAAPQAAGVWAVDLPAMSGVPENGMHGVIIAPANTGTTVSILLNGQGPFPLVSRSGVPIDGTTIPEGAPLSVVLANGELHCLNGPAYARAPCALGTVAVSNTLCMQPVEHPASDFFAASITCGDQGLRLCSWGELAAACSNAAALGLIGMANNWEWTNDASNEDGSVRIVNAAGCTSAGNALATGSTPRAFRCCQTR
jgi:hypothetical protein